MRRRRKKKELSAGDPNPEEWDLPNVDAEGYIHDFVDRLIADSQEDDSPPAMPRDEPARAGSRDDEVDSYTGDWRDEYEMHAEPDVSSAEIKELLATATYALSNGDADDLLGSLESLLDALGARSVQLGGVEDWSRMLVDTSARERDDEPVNESERLVIGAINDLCARLCEIIARDGGALRQVEWRELERIVATALSGIGFDVTLTPASKDGGKDVVATCLLRGRRLTYYIEIKHWRSAKRVNEGPVFDFVEVNACEGTDGGLFLSTSGFTPAVFSQLSELCQHRVRLGGTEKIVSLCQHFVRKSRGIWTTRQILPTILFQRTVG